MLIGLTGVSRSGKDSVAAILCRKYDFRQVALATNIRNILLDMNPLLGVYEGTENASVTRLVTLHNELHGDWDKIKAASRESVDLMISLGQSVRDVISEDSWINAAFPTMSYRNTKQEGHIVISDIRQPNEVEFLHRWGGELWKIERPELGDQKRGMDDLLKDVHFDATLINDGTLQDLEDDIDTVMQQDWFQL